MKAGQYAFKMSAKDLDHWSRCPVDAKSSSKCSGARHVCRVQRALAASSGHAIPAGAAEDGEVSHDLNHARTARECGTGTPLRPEPSSTGIKSRPVSSLAAELVIQGGFGPPNGRVVLVTISFSGFSSKHNKIGSHIYIPTSTARIPIVFRQCPTLVLWP